MARTLLFAQTWRALFIFEPQSIAFPTLPTILKFEALRGWTVLGNPSEKGIYSDTSGIRINPSGVPYFVATVQHSRELLS